MNVSKYADFNPMDYLGYHVDRLAMRAQNPAKNLGRGFTIRPSLVEGGVNKINYQGLQGVVNGHPLTAKGL